MGYNNPDFETENPFFYGLASSKFLGNFRVP